MYKTFFIPASKTNTKPSLAAACKQTQAVPIDCSTIDSAINSDIFYINIQCIRNKIDELEMFLINKNFKALCLVEHWLRNEEIDFYKLNGFILSSIFSRTQFKNGGVSIFIRENIDFNEINMSSFCIEKDFEIVAIVLLNIKIILVCLYRSPSGNVNTFFEKLEYVLKYFNDMKMKVVICGDFNINVNTNDALTIYFQNLLRMFGFYCTNTEPTRLLACLDNIITNFSKHEYNVQVFDPVLSDHSALIMQLNILNLTNLVIERKLITSKRLMTSQRLCNFIDILNDTNWDTILNSCANDAELK